MASLVFRNGSSEVTLVNPSDRDWTRRRFVLAFGDYGWTQCVVWANSLDDALDEAVDWIAEHAPGLLADDSVREEFERLVAEGATEEEAWEEATVDTTCAGNSGHYLLSYEWAIVAEDPTRDEMLSILGRAQ